MISTVVLVLELVFLGLTDMSNRNVKRQRLISDTTNRGDDGSGTNEEDAQETVDKFNKLVILMRPQVLRVAQESRLLDKSAAMLISGAAGLPMRGVVWVDCNMETEWFDKNDEKKLMAVAWNDVIGGDNKTIKGVEQLVHTDLGQNCPDGIVDAHRIKNIERVLKTFRKSQLSMQLFSLSPSTEAVLSGIVIDLLDTFESELSGFTDTEQMMFETRSSVFEHDDRVRRMSRIFRRLPLTRNEFCRVAGTVLRYNISLQEGVALSTRRLNQIQFDMRNAVNNWTQFVERNITKIVHELKVFWADDLSFYIFNWSTHRLKILDSEQYNLVPAKHGASVEEEIMHQEINGTRVCEVDDDVSTQAQHAADEAAINNDLAGPRGIRPEVSGGTGGSRSRYSVNGNADKTGRWDW